MKKTNQNHPTRRCVIYTRKSHEEGLEQDFNSLDAQRESCEAFILSQRHEGWKASPKRYDDGGYSGGTMKRPGLQKLLSEIDTGEIDIVVVYKVDRLTRALSDFSKIVEVFDAKGVSFVSVTQQFNTTTSMGRLTLNVLLSFAQFEREVTGERIRDKIAASKKKGMWMGGRPPLGYDPVDRKLTVNGQEAKTVQRIYETYVQLGSVRRLKEALDAEGVMSKSRTDRNGKRWGGNPFTAGALYKILKNPVYIGEIVHKESRHPGAHDAILDRKLWERVQKILAENSIAQKNGARAKTPSLLAGLLWDESGDRLSPNHAVKRGKRYRYYVSRRLLTKTKAAGGMRIPAADIEQIVIQKLRAFLSNRSEMFTAISPHVGEAAEQNRLLDLSASLSKKLPDLSQAEIRRLLLALIPRIEVHPNKVEIHLLPAHLISHLQGQDEDFPAASKSSQKDELILSVPARLRRRGLEMKMIIEGSQTGGSADPGLIRLIAKAHAMKEKLVTGSASLRQMAKQEKIAGSYLTRLIRLTFLAPDITKAILEGRQPPGLTTARLMRNSRLPLDWREQRDILGFA